MTDEQLLKHNEEVKSAIAALIDVQDRLCFRDLGFCHGVFQDLYVSYEIEEKFKKFIQELTTDIIIDLANKLYADKT
jgi:hypothetical protein